jgi:DNA-binding NarL/FixJ family response regulator
MEHQMSLGEKQIIRVIIADNHRLVRQSIKMFLQQADDIEIIGEAWDGQEAVELTERLTPDVLVIDADMLYLSGFRAIELIQRLELGTRVVMLSLNNDEILIQQALQYGANAYVPKYLIPAELLPAIRTIYEGRVYHSYYHQFSNWEEKSD